jgi:single-strand DNA-binding protein
VTEVVADNVQFLSPNGEKRESGGYSPTGRGNAADPFHHPFENDSKLIDINDDDLPF